MFIWFGMLFGSPDSEPTTASEAGDDAAGEACVWPSMDALWLNAIDDLLSHALCEGTIEVRTRDEGTACRRSTRAERIERENMVCNDSDMREVNSARPLFFSFLFFPSF